MKFIIYAILTQRARAENLKKSICHFLTNRKCPFFSISQLESEENYYEFGRVRLNKLWSFSSIFVWRFDLILSALPFWYCKKQIDVSFSCVCPVIDNEFRHNLVKVAVDPQGEFMINNRTDAWKTDVNLLIICLSTPFADHLGEKDIHFCEV